ncbi:MAG: hypothetical protein HY241_13110 [Actinobacteria bacterium]|nr:hypothetical protein [Actinomycetota bacterium]
MATIRELLARFRPAAVPGAATAAGVPADRRASIEAELAPVLAVLATVGSECAGIRSAAHAEALRRRDDAAGRAHALVARARADAPAQSAAAAAVVQRIAEAELAELATSAEREAIRVRQQVRRRMPDLVADVRDRVRAELTGLVSAQLLEPSHEDGMGSGRRAGAGDGAPAAGRGSGTVAGRQP